MTNGYTIQVKYTKKSLLNCGQIRTRHKEMSRLAREICPKCEIIKLDKLDNCKKSKSFKSAYRFINPNQMSKFSYELRQRYAPISVKLIID